MSPTKTLNKYSGIKDFSIACTLQFVYLVWPISAFEKYFASGSNVYLKNSFSAKCIHLSDGVKRWHTYCEGNSYPESVLQKYLIVYTVIKLEEYFICRST